MTDENETDQQDTAAADSSAVRVPNVTPGAVSGLDHSPLGSDAVAPDTDLEASEGSDDGVVDAEVDLPDEVVDADPDDAEGSADGTDPDAADQATTGSDDGAVAGNVLASEVDSQPGADEDGFGGDAPDEVVPPADGQGDQPVS